MRTSGIGVEESGPPRETAVERELRLGELMLRAAALDSEDRRMLLEETVADRSLVLEVERRLRKVMAELPSAFLAEPTGLAAAVLEQGEVVVEPVPLSPEDRYELGDELGSGGMARVCKATDRQLHRTVALKLLHPDAARRAGALREARAQAKVRHPHVLEVYETGELHGEAYIAMQYVGGGTLDELCDRLPLETRVRLLAQVAEGLHAAHRQGLVHRDVKPSNVLIEESEDGEWVPYVGDFGIALALAEAAGPSMRVSGTPAFMSPEHLRGDAIDRRADVYSLGVTLYRVLTGRLPFDAGPRELLIEQILAGACPPPRERVPSLPKELEAVVLKAMAPSLDDRYPSARAVADDLRRYLDGEVVEAYASTLAYRLTRQVLKHRALLGIAGVALVVVVVALVVFSVLTRKAKNVAELRRGQAEELLSFMVGDLRSKLAPVNRLEVLEDIGTKALQYFASVPPDELATGELAKRSKALYQIGDVRMRQGDRAAALEAFEESFKLAESLHRRDPRRAEWLFELGQSHFWIGYVQFDRGELAAALERFEAYLDIALRLVEREPENHNYLMEVAYGHDNVGRVHEARGDSAEALPHFTRHGEILRRLIEADPERLAYRADLAGSTLLVGRIHAAAGRLPEALAAFRESQGILQELGRRQPDQLDWRERLATCHHYLGETLAGLGDLEAAVIHHEAQAEIFHRLTVADPGNARWRFFTVVASAALARLARQRSQWPRQRAHLEAALPVIEELLAKDPSKTSWRRQGALLGIELAESLRRQGAVSKALEEAETAREILEDALFQGVGNATAALHASRANLTLAAVYADSGEEEKARNHWRRAHELSVARLPHPGHQDVVSHVLDALDPPPSL